MSIWSSFRRRAQSISQRFSDFAQHCGLVVLDLVSLVPLLITIFSYYRMSTLQALQRLYKYSYGLKYPTKYHKNWTKKKKKNKISQENQILDVARALFSQRRRKELLKQIYQFRMSYLPAARRCCTLIILDILVLPLDMIHFINPRSKQELKNKILEQRTEMEDIKSIKKYYEAEKKLILLRFEPIYEITMNVLKIVSAFTIVACLIRIKSTFRRLQAYRRYTEAILKQKRIEEKSKSQRLSLNDLTWDTYGRICQYLTVTDLARLSQVNRKLNELTSKDFYWEYQFNRDWVSYGKRRKVPSFREKCICIYEQTNKDLIKMALTEGERDRLCGSAYIMLDEAVRSIKAIPWILLIPANLISFILLKMFKPAHKHEHYLYLRSSHMIDEARLWMVPVLNKYPFKVLVATRENFHSLHFDLGRWFFVTYLKYVSEWSYFLNYIGYMIIKKTSAGGYNPMQVQYHPDTNEFTVTQNDQVDNIENVGMRIALYCVQLVLWCAYVSFVLCVSMIPPCSIAYISKNYSESQIFVVIKFLAILLHGVILGDVLVTQQRIINYSGSCFRLLEPFKMIYILLRSIYRRLLRIFPK